MKEQVFALHVATRNNLLTYLENVTPEKLAQIPDGHVPTADEIQELRALLISTQKQLQADYERGVFANFTPYTTSYGYALTCIEDAIHFNNTHEGMHLGVVIALNYFAK